MYLTSKDPEPYNHLVCCARLVITAIMTILLIAIPAWEGGNDNRKALLQFSLAIPGLQPETAPYRTFKEKSH